MKMFQKLIYSRFVTQRLPWLIAPLLFIGVTIIALLLTPDPKGYGTHQQLGLPACTFYYLTGWVCPSCGLTTSFSHMVHLQWKQAFSAHVFGPFLYLSFAVLAFFSMLEACGKKTFLRSTTYVKKSFWIYLIVGIFFLTWILRLFLQK